MVDNLHKSKTRILFLNRSYWPDVEASGQLLTELCEDLTDQFEVTVIAGHPNHNPSGVAYRTVGLERHNGVWIRRVFNTQFQKKSLLGKAVNLSSYMVTASLAALLAARPAVVVVETDPPLLGLLGALLRYWHRCQLIVYLQDIYPEVAVALGKLPAGRLSDRLRSLFHFAFSRADRIVVLSRDMKDLLVEEGLPSERIRRISNWADTDQVYPVKSQNRFRENQRINGQFVVMYSGNIGLSQRLENLLAAADQLRDRADVLFLLIGDGAVRLELERKARRMKLANVRFLGYQPKTELAQSLSAADVHYVPLDPCAARCLMPSKLYGVLASGTPVLAAAPEFTEMAQLVTHQKVGWVIPPNKPQALADRVCWCAEHRDQLELMGQHARQLALQCYARRTGTSRFAQMLKHLTEMDEVPNTSSRHDVSHSSTRRSAPVPLNQG